MKTNTANKVVLQVEWAYPTSENAKGYPKGCYCIECTLIDGSDVQVRTLPGRYATFNDAVSALGAMEKSLKP